MSVMKNSVPQLAWAATVATASPQPNRAPRIIILPMNRFDKGQLISKYPFGVLKSPQKPTIFISISALAKRGQIKKVVQESK
jgi:hypothetical protein